MIEVVAAANGEKVLKFKGRLLASRFDPSREARDWVASRTAFLKDIHTVFILGAGSGHHVVETLNSTSAQIVVLDTSLEVIENVEKLHRFESKRVRFEQISSARALRANVSVKEAVTKSFVVLVHTASTAVDPKIYSECRSQLLGRDWGSLTWQWKMRNAPEFDSTTRIDSESKALTIHDLEQTELVRNSEERERLLLKALRELVK